MTLKEFLESYEGFDYEGGEIVLVNQRTAKSYICRYRDRELKTFNPLHVFTNDLEMPVWNWTHTESTMLITL